MKSWHADQGRVAIRRRLARALPLLGLMLLLVLTACGGYRHHIRAMDTNGDGKLSQKEWGQRFDTADANHDGLVTEDELKASHRCK